MSKFKYFTSCYYCKPPKRHPGCHATCPEYAEDKKNYDNMMADSVMERKMDDVTRTPGFYRALRRKRNKERK